MLDQPASHRGTGYTLLVRLLVQLALTVLVGQARVDSILRLGRHETARGLVSHRGEWHSGHSKTTRLFQDFLKVAGDLKILARAFPGTVHRIALECG